MAGALVTPSEDLLKNAGSLQWTRTQDVLCWEVVGWGARCDQLGTGLN